MGGDKCGSHFLEAVLECCEIETLIYNLNNVLKGSSSEFATDGAGNFVLQSCLRRLSLELPKIHDISLNNNCNMLANSLLTELSEPEFIIKILNIGKGGVLLWMIELARSTLHRKDTKKCIYWGETLGNILINHWTADGSNQLVTILANKFTSNSNSNKNGNDNTSSNKKDDGMKMSGQQTLDARLIGALLKLDGDISTVTSTAVSRLPGQILFNMATSGPISRAILDPLFENSTTSSLAISTITTAITPYIGELANHFVGQHIIRRIFEKADSKAKEKLVKAIDANKDQLNKSKEGRSSLRVVQAELYSRKPDEWRQLMNKQAHASQMLLDLENVASNKIKKKKKKDKVDEDNDNDNKNDDNEDNNNEDNNEVEAGEKRKRKRKRKDKNSSI